MPPIVPPRRCTDGDLTCVASVPCTDLGVATHAVRAVRACASALHFAPLPRAAKVRPKAPLKAWLIKACRGARKRYPLVDRDR